MIETRATSIVFDEADGYCCMSVFHKDPDTGTRLNSGGSLSCLTRTQALRLVSAINDALERMDTRPLVTVNMGFRIIADASANEETTDFIMRGTALAGRVKARFNPMPGQRLRFREGVAELAAPDDIGDHTTEIIEVLEVERLRYDAEEWRLVRVREPKP